MGEILSLDLSSVLFSDFTFFFSVLEVIFFDSFDESFVEFLLLLTLDLISFEADFVKFLDKELLRGALDSTFVLFFEEPSLIDLVDFTLIFVSLVVAVAFLVEDLGLVVFLEV